MKLLDRILNFISALLRSAGALALTLMMLITVVDVVGRFFKHPIFGSVEIVGFLAVAVAAAAMPHTYKVGGHVGVEIITRLLPPQDASVAGSVHPDPDIDSFCRGGLADVPLCPRHAAGR